MTHVNLLTWHRYALAVLAVWSVALLALLLSRPAPPA
jgi:hypothetical protein